jgi:paraquat-inducible protein A
MANARGPHRIPLSARAAGLIACHQCGRVHPFGIETCLRCGAALHSRDPMSLQKVWAWWLAGLMAYVPANLYPMLITTSLGKTSENTLLGGVIELAHIGSYGVAGIVFFASIMIPIGKMIAIPYLAVKVARPDRRSAHLRHWLFEVVEFIGRWSMIDVFVVAILSSLVQLGGVVSIKPGVAALCFALSVAFTMLAAISFDSRLIWDADEGNIE